MSQTPDASFEDPFTILVGCHRRIERFIADLKRSAELLTRGQHDESVSRAIGDALHFFRVAAPLHTRDEEESLIPRLNKAMRVSDEMYEHTVKHILDDHQELDELHLEIDRLGLGLIETLSRQGGLEEVSKGEALAAFASAVEKAEEIYTSHMIVEERDVAPLAKAIIPPEELRAIGREMAERRGIDPDAPPPDLGDHWKTLG
ncbi:MAG: hemerythrin domain-containing protein [Planctomycetes bacterium]|nr:hemerythrin domain-containing protein [Planctomycetota bacterium]